MLACIYWNGEKAIFHFARKLHFYFLILSISLHFERLSNALASATHDSIIFLFVFLLLVIVVFSAIHFTPLIKQRRIQLKVFRIQIRFAVSMCSCTFFFSFSLYNFLICSSDIHILSFAMCVLRHCWSFGSLASVPLDAQPLNCISYRKNAQANYKLDKNEPVAFAYVQV